MIHEVLEQLWNDPSQRIRKQFYEGMPAAAFIDMMEAMVQNPDRVAYNFEIFTRGLLEQEIQGARKVVQDFDICWNANKSIYPPVVTEGNAMASSMEFSKLILFIVSSDNPLFAQFFFAWSILRSIIVSIFIFLS